MADRFTDDELDRLRDLHAEGKSCRAIANDLGRAFSAVSRHCRDMGLTFDTARTIEATEVRVTANRAKRADLEARLLDEAGELLDQLHVPHLVYNWSKENEFAQHELDEPDVAAKRALIAAAGVAIDKAIKLADTDKAVAEAAVGKSMVGALFGMFQAAAPVLAEPAEDAADQGDTGADG